MFMSVMSAVLEGSFPAETAPGKSITCWCWSNMWNKAVASLERVLVLGLEAPLDAVVGERPAAIPGVQELLDEAEHEAAPGLGYPVVVYPGEALLEPAALPRTAPGNK